MTNGTADPVHQIDALLGGGLISAVAMIAIFFGTVAVNAMNDYSGSLSLLAAGIKVWRPVSALIVGVLSFIATLWLYQANFNSTFENYLLRASPTGSAPGRRSCWSTGSSASIPPPEPTTSRTSACCPAAGMP